MGGVLPDQPGGTSLDHGLLTNLFAVTNDGTIPGLSGLTQPFIEGFLKQREIKESPGWLGASSSLFSGLLSGVAFVPNLLMNLATSILGLPFGMWPGTGPLGFLGEIPNILADMGNFFNNITGIFGLGIDFNSLVFDPLVAVYTFVTDMLLPTGLIGSLIDGFLDVLQIPGLDASKIISGEFAMSFITDLPGFFNIFTGGTGVLGDAGNMITNLLSLFDIGSVLDLTGDPGSFDPLAILESWISLVITPLNLLAPLVSGFIPDLNIPGLDASKITTGLFDQTQITNLVSDLSDRVLGSVFGTFQDYLGYAFDGVSFVSGLNYSGVFTRVQSMIQAITAYIPNISNATTMGTERLQEMYVLADYPVTAINGYITNIYDWWTHEDWVWW